MSWFATGYDAIVEEDTRKKDASRVSRFWMPQDAEKVVTFVDDDTTPREVIHDGQKYKLEVPFVVKEHQMQLNGHWRNFFTCLRPMGQTCPICENSDSRASQVAVYTVIDHSEWEDRNGTKHKDELKLYVVKTSSSTYKLLQKLASKRKGLRGCTVTISRLGDKSPNVGNSYDFEEKVELDESIQAYNYLDCFAPKSADELEGIVGAVVAETEDPVPF